MLTESKPNHTSKTCFQRAKELYLEATRMPQAKIAAFLDAECGENNALRREVELLLELESSEPTWIADQPKTRTQAPELMPDDVIADHRIIRKLGEGGMGTVYLAKDIELNCEVAFKVLHRAHDTPVFNAQFIQERRTLAMMQHPAIARVRQAGFTPGGRAWFTMDYINGSTLTAYCDQNKLELHQRLELLIKICDAVQYAHGKMVIHRDLNPNNILVTTDERGQPQPHLIDFGISRLLEQDEERSESLPARCGTPPYMSPEQYLGQVDQVEVRSDIYALGVLLYKLTAGCEPFERQLLKKSIQELGTFLANTTPQLPSDRFLELPPSEQSSIASRMNMAARKLVKRLRQGIDWIAFSAVNPQREDRYSSADALASDLKRFLSLQPLEVLLSNRPYRTKLFLRRNWVAISTISLIIYLLIGGTTFAVIQKNRLAEQVVTNHQLLQGSDEAIKLLQLSLIESEEWHNLAYQHPEIKANATRRLVTRLDASNSIDLESMAKLRFTIGNIYLRLSQWNHVPLWSKAENQLLKAKSIYQSLDGDHQKQLSQIDMCLKLIRNSE